MGDKIRINRYLAMSGISSRRECEKLIKSGRVSVNGKILKELSIFVDPETDDVRVDGEKTHIVSKHLVLVLNKPVGVMSTVKDTHGRKTVIDIAREHGFEERLFPVGRLDLNSSGIILITNDGDLAYRIAHPKFNVTKTYEVVIVGEPSDESIEKIKKGLKLPDLITSPCEARIIKKKKEETVLEVKLNEGKKREIRRIFAHFGNKVIKLHRKAIGNLRFDDLREGAIRPLKKDELSELERAIRVNDSKEY